MAHEGSDVRSQEDLDIDKQDPEVGEHETAKEDSRGGLRVDSAACEDEIVESVASADKNLATSPRKKDTTAPRLASRTALKEKQKRKRLSVSEKLEILAEFQGGATQASTMRKWSISRRTCSAIKSQEAELENALKSGYGINTLTLKSVHAGRLPELEGPLVAYLHTAWGGSLPRRKIIKAQALKIRDEILKEADSATAHADADGTTGTATSTDPSRAKKGLDPRARKRLEDFSASKNWIHNFIQRNDMKHLTRGWKEGGDGRDSGHAVEGNNTMKVGCQEMPCNKVGTREDVPMCAGGQGVVGTGLGKGQGDSAGGLRASGAPTGFDVLSCSLERLSRCVENKQELNGLGLKGLARLLGAAMIDFYEEYAADVEVLSGCLEEALRRQRLSVKSLERLPAGRLYSLVVDGLRSNTVYLAMDGRDSFEANLEAFLYGFSTRNSSS